MASHALKAIADMKAQRVLGWQPRAWEDAVVATAESLMKFGVA